MSEMITENFSREEIACKCGCGISNIDLEFMNKVQMLRTHFDQPMMVTSGCRCPEWNKKQGGAKNSAHLSTATQKCYALDIRIIGHNERHDFLRLATQMFDGVGVYHGWIHIDNRKGPTCWVG